MTSTSPFRVVLFDMDGVLVDVSSSYRRVIEETVRLFIGTSVRAGQIQEYKNRGGFNDDWRLTEAIVNDAGVFPPFDRIVDEFNRRYRGADWTGYITQERALISGKDLAALSARFELMGIVTGRPRVEAEWTVQHNGWSDTFPVRVVLEDQDGRPKPDPWPLHVAMSRMDGRIEPSDCVYIGDSVDDMASARAAGMRAVGFVPPYLERSVQEPLLIASGADGVIDDHADLARMLESLT